MSADVQFKLSFTIVNFVYDKIRDEINDYLRYSKFEPDIGILDKIELTSQLGLESALKCTEIFKAKIENNNSAVNFNRLSLLISLNKRTRNRLSTRVNLSKALLVKFISRLGFFFFLLFAMYRHESV